MLDYSILSLIIWVPIVTGVIVLALGASDNSAAGKWTALIGSLVGLLLVIPIWVFFDTLEPLMQFEESALWIETLNINYHLGIDGISFLLVFLNCLTTFIVILASWEFVAEKICQYLYLKIINLNQG